MSSQQPETPSGVPRRWQPLGPIDRRVLGVLGEKAKTTPDAYPMSLNAVCTGCNQKSNRDPLMQLEPDDVEESLDRLRELGAVGLVEGYGRVAKYRHYLYDWLGADKVELAVMVELLLRGDQTVGELRGRAARMEPINDLGALRPVLDSLISKGLVHSLTPEGRGQVVTHALYKPRELEILRAKYSGVLPCAATGTETAPSAAMPTTDRGTAASGPSVDRPDAVSVDSLRREVHELTAQVIQLQRSLEESLVEQRRLGDEVRALKDALGV